MFSYTIGMISAIFAFCTRQYVVGSLILAYTQMQLSELLIWYGIDHKNIKVVDNVMETIKSADLIIVLTEWPEFSSIKPSEIAANFSVNKIIDTRGILSRKNWEASGFKFWGLKD
jgi:UDP-glucose 6-dehydrogenase